MTHTTRGGRRWPLVPLAALLSLLALAVAAAGCGDDDDDEAADASTAAAAPATSGAPASEAAPEPSTAPAAATGAGETTAAAEPSGEPLKVALLVPALTNDGSFNQVALEAVQRLQDEGLITFELREKMGDPSQSEPVIREFAEKGFDLVIGHGIELGEPIFKVAERYPDVHFTASGGLDILERGTENVETWTYDSFQFGYLGGWVAGKVSGIETVGIVEGPDFPFITINDEGFQAGLKETNPQATVVPPVYTGSFTDLQKAAEATRAVIDRGAQLVYTGSDFGNAVASAAAERGVLTVGTVGEAAAQVNIATVELDMYPIFRAWVDRVRDGSFGTQGTTSTIANGGLAIHGVNVVDERVPADLEAQIARLKDDLASGAETLPAPGA